MLKPSQILIVEDVAETRDWLAKIVRQVFADASVHMAAHLQQARELLAREVIDLALVDIHLPDGNGIRLLQNNSLSSDIYWVMTTAFSNDDYVFEALRAGALGYVLKEQSAQQVARHLLGIIDGQPPLSPTIAQKVLRHFQPQSCVELTPRELQILALIAQGFPLKAVANELCISFYTAGDHVKHIYRKLHVHNRAEAITQAMHHGLLRPEWQQR